MLNFYVFPLYSTGLKSKSESPVDKTAADSVKLVEAFNKLKHEHVQDLPQTIDKVNRHISNLKDVLSNPNN